MSLKQVRSYRPRLSLRGKLTVELQEIETWVKALTYYDSNEFDESLRAFDAIADTSKILFNCGVIHATLGEHEKAVSLLPPEPLAHTLDGTSRD